MIDRGQHKNRILAMPNTIRTELEQELVDAFIETKAINFEAIGNIISKYGARAAKSGTDLVTIINKNIIINCGWPGPDIGRAQIQRIAEANR
jgi:hypothetical protein